MNEVGSAYVRIRPNMSGFTREAETGVRSSFSQLAKIAGVAFGAKEAFDFGKEIVGHAADVQRQVRAIGGEFGAAAKEITEFSEKGAAGLGISAHLADSTAARFGILFKNLGIGGDQAAQMTIGFEKLAGSLSQIRNIDPAAALQNLPLAVAGNLRSLKQLGIATDQNQLKIAAFKLGLTQTITQALTPAQRAMAIYAVATSKLGEYQRQAAAHSDDLAVRQRKLRAEWDNAKDSLGRGLLPPMTRLVGYLSDKLPGALETTRRDFKALGSVVGAAAKPIGGAADAVKALVAAFVISKLVAFAGALSPVRAGLRVLGPEAVAASAEYVSAFGAMEIATIGLKAQIRGLLASTGIGLVLVALGLAAEYVLTHWDKVKRWFGVFASNLTRILGTAWVAVKEGGKAAAYEIIQYFTVAIRGILELASHLPFVGKYARRALDAIQTEIDKFNPNFSAITDAWRAGGKHAGSAYVDGLRQSIHAQVKTFGGTLPALSALLGKQVNDKASASVIAKPSTANVVKRETDATNAALTTLQAQLKNTIAANDAGITKIRSQLGTLNQNLRDAVTQESKDIRDAVEQAKENLGSIASSLTGTISAVLDKPLQDAQNKINALANRKAVSDLRRSALLPGGKTLSTDPATAIRELENLRSHASALSRDSIDSFIAQYKAAYLTVKGDQVQAVKDSTTRNISDLTDSFNRGQITLTQYKKRILGILTKDHVSYKRAGALLGSAFANGFRDQVQGLFTQAGVIGSSSQVKGATGSTISIVRPLEAIRDDQKQVASIQKQIRDKHGALLTRIAKDGAKQADLLAKIHSVTLGPSASIVKKNPGNEKKRADALSGTTG